MTQLSTTPSEQLTQFIHHAEPESSFATFGLETPAQWQDTLEALLTTINDYCQQHNLPLPKMIQIKEKFGTLRIHWAKPDGYSDDHIADIEAFISTAKEKCHSPELIHSPIQRKSQSENKPPIHKHFQQ